MPQILKWTKQSQRICCTNQLIVDAVLSTCGQTTTYLALHIRSHIFDSDTICKFLPEVDVGEASNGFIVVFHYEELSSHSFSLRK